MHEKVIKFLGQIEIDFEKAKARTVKLQEYQQILKLPIDDFEVLDAVSADLNLKSKNNPVGHILNSITTETGK